MSISFRFRAFRRAFLGFLAFTSAVSIILCLYRLPYSLHRNVFWMISAFQGASLFSSIWSAIRKPVFKKSQSVGAEIVQLFVLLPFLLITVLIIFTIPIEITPFPILKPVFLRASLLASGITCMVYTSCLLVLTVLTAAAYDADVWVRDIESSPSPFPLPLLWAFIISYFRCFSGDVGKEERQDPTFCPPGCTCNTKSHPGASETSRELSPESGPPALSGGSNRSSLNGTLIRVPDAMERRSSIVIAFEV